MQSKLLTIGVFILISGIAWMLGGMIFDIVDHKRNPRVSRTELMEHVDDALKGITTVGDTTYYGRTPEHPMDTATNNIAVGGPETPWGAKPEPEEPSEFQGKVHFNDPKEPWFEKIWEAERFPNRDNLIIYHPNKPPDIHIKVPCRGIPEEYGECHFEIIVETRLILEMGKEKKEDAE